MKEYWSSISPKGQITIPMDVRRRWGIGPKARIAIRVEEEVVTIAPASHPVDETFGVLPPLNPPRTVEEMTEIAAAEHARAAASDGL